MISDQRESSVARASGQGAQCQRVTLEDGRGHCGGHGKKHDFPLRAMQRLKLKPRYKSHTLERNPEIRVLGKETCHHPVWAATSSCLDTEVPCQHLRLHPIRVLSQCRSF